MKTIFTCLSLVTLAVTLAGCSATSTNSQVPSPGSSTAESVAGKLEMRLVEERFGECLNTLGIQGEFSFEMEPSVSGAGVVTLTSTDSLLTWETSITETGDVLTNPLGAETVSVLNSVGC